jgi:hypothetical protein
MEQRAEELRSSAADYERQDNPAAAHAARQEAERWMHKATAAKSQLQEVGDALQQKTRSLAACEKAAPGLLRGEEEQGGDRPIPCPQSNNKCRVIIQRQSCKKHRCRSLCSGVGVGFCVNIHLDIWNQLKSSRLHVGVLNRVA